MKTVLLCVAVFAVSICSAQDFSDPEFNRIIDDELIAIAEGKDKFLRNRRDVDEEDERSSPFDQDEGDEVANGLPDHPEPNDDSSHHKNHCKKHHKTSCCGKPPLPISFTQHSNNQTARSPGSECYEEVDAKMGNKTLESDMDPYNCEKVKRMKKRHYCMHECKAKKMEVANGEGALDFPKVKDLLLSRVNETWQKEILGQAVDTCANNKYDETWKDEKEEYKCNPQALQFKHCVWKQVEMKCPEEHQNTGRHCKKLRGKLAAEKTST